jgi:hypothetical protein
MEDAVNGTVDGGMEDALEDALEDDVEDALALGSSHLAWRPAWILSSSAAAQARGPVDPGTGARRLVARRAAPAAAA